MEPVGFAVGVVGLVGLFNTCLDILDKFDSWKDYGSESRALTAQFSAHRIQLERWGQAVGLGTDGLSDQHDKLLDDPQTLSTVEELLSAIRDICRYQEDTDSKSKPAFDGHTHSLAPLESKRQKLKWALRDKAKRTTQVEQFSSIVQTLHALVPIKDGGCSVMSNHGELNDCDETFGHLNAAYLAPGGCIAEFERVLRRIESDIEAETKRDLQTWLLGNHLPNDRYEQYVENRMVSTCEWVLDRDWFQDWYSSSFPNGNSKFLWINGPAGFGKSVLCTKVIDYLSSISDAPVASFFFSSDIEREDPYVAIRSWVSQVMSQPAAFSLVRERWEAQERQKATRGDVVSLLRDVVKSIPGCTFILDGLDECIWQNGNKTTGHDDLIPGFIEALMQATADADVRVMIVSRDEPEIRTCLDDQSHGASLFEHKITPDDVQSDVLSFSQKLVHDELRKSTAAAKESLSQKLADRCNGQFLWVKLQQRSLRRNSWKSHRELERVIKSTPTGLEDIYERNWMKILKLPGEDRDRAFSLLRWAAFSLRPLTVAEMTEALLISEDCDEVRADQLPEYIDMDYIDNGISFYCGSLLEIRSPHAECEDGEKTIHLAHFSVKQYLLYNFSRDSRFLQLDMKPGSFTEPFENMLLARMCLRYLNSPAVLQGNFGDGQEELSGDDQEELSGHDQVEYFEGNQTLNAFFDYAASSWRKHVDMTDQWSESDVDLLIQLFDTTRPNWKFWREWFDSHDRSFHPNKKTMVNNPASPLCYAARLGFFDLIHFLIYDCKHSTEEKTCSEMTSLTIACSQGHLEIAQLLLESGADINASDNEGLTPLLIASDRGRTAVIELLLEHGANTEVMDKHGWTPSMAASASGEVALVKLLLENGANLEFKTSGQEGSGDPNERSNNGLTPAMAASAYGHVDVVKLLFEHGIDMEVKSEDGMTAAMIASEYGQLAVVKFLLESGVDMEDTNDKGLTAAIIASFNGHVDVLRFLLQNGVDVQSKCESGWTPALAASSRGMIAVVKLLIDHGVDIEAPVNFGWTPFSIAALEGHVEVMKVLLEHGVDINIADDKRCRPLHFALSNGQLAVLKFLLENGVDIEAPNSWGLTPVTFGSAYGHVELVKLLIQHGPDLGVADKWGSTPLHHAASDGHPGMIALLLENGADFRASEISGWTPLHHASNRGHLEAAKLLLQFSAATLDLQEKTGRTALFLAATHGHTEVVKLLLSYNALTDIKDCYNTRALGVAIRNEHEGVVELLLAATNPATDLEDELGHSMAWWVKTYKNKKIIELWRQWVEKMGIELMGSDCSWDGVLTASDQLYRRCNICSRLRFWESAYYYCTICPHWEACLECNGIDGRSFHSHHEWALQPADDSS